MKPMNMGNTGNPAEVRIQRHQIEAFLAADPAMIELRRFTLTRTSAGGLTKSSAVRLNAQRFRMVPFKRRLTVMTRDTPDGVIFRIDYVLIGKHDANVEEHDEFTYNNVYYRVVSIEPNREYRTAAHVVGQGKPHGGSSQ